MLSGFILAYTYLPSRETVFGWAEYRSFIVKRFARVYPLHLATFLVFVGLCFAAKRIGHEFAHSDVDYTARTAVENLLLLHAWGLENKLSWNFVSWSISAEWFAYLFLFPLCAKVLSRLPRVTCGVVVLACWLMLCVYCFLYNDGDVGLTTFGVLRIVPQFMAGYWLFRLVKTWEVGEVAMCVGLVALMILMCLPTTLPFMLLPPILLVIAGLASGGVIGKAVFGCLRVSPRDFVFDLSHSPDSADRLQPGRQKAACAAEPDRRHADTARRTGHRRGRRSARLLPDRGAGVPRVHREGASMARPRSEAGRRGDAKGARLLIGAVSRQRRAVQAIAKQSATAKQKAQSRGLGFLLET
ncbi:acyltransferase [Paraburkholderia sprentiae WSM5005]|uniref:Acyltransferase n=1 Tax=Paraburkholderia sprentiae WSM5005 TaxID=754502 RepID=A0A1I9YCT1_9BURK|nr:acyltransferase [Paraburkholderia sprentiae]APA84114.1 acyltransferase [Paraburkholderia sprentiae WSM5005]